MQDSIVMFELGQYVPTSVFVPGDCNVEIAFLIFHIC